MKLWTVLLAGGTLMASPALAQNISINFDDQYAGSDISTAYTAQGITFSSTNATGAAYTDFLPGADNTNANRGIDASSDFVAGNVTAALASDLYGTAFGIDLVSAPNGYGVSTGQFVTFYDAGGNQVGSVAVDQTVNSHISYTPTSASGYFTTVVLPADAYYDNLSIAAAPEPSAWAALATGALGIGLLARRRRACA